MSFFFFYVGTLSHWDFKYVLTNMHRNMSVMSLTASDMSHVIPHHHPHTMSLGPFDWYPSYAWL